ncbi:MULTISPECIES: Cof-type HAD-IIB family hydrolase [Nocardioides]|uniref:Cof-type HAD-IIB family hydrolase n=1 Tax=Nocardioides vastitatis TaxID=2568655 RepID=A0ABW0ZKN7_9ACTN|nr:Cof-type HAD-IIB family hydrolase [Nocardioides sp.]THJ06479.1 HAD family hydrolase [Nocardioides sp.]
MTDLSEISTLPEIDDLRLVVADLDGTLLDGDGALPPGIWPLLELMRSAGVAFVPASGRQYATLARMFSGVSDGMAFIAENGALVVRDGVEVSSSPLPRRTVADAVGRLRELSAGRDLGVVVCGKRSAYVERTDRAFVAHAEPYYAELARVADLLAVDDEVIKIAVYDFTDARGVEPTLAPLRDAHQVVVSGRHWIDVMSGGTDKGVAVRRLQQELGVTAAQTVAFGDYLNDLGMLDAADLSFAVENAHETVRRRARYSAPSNLEHGVITTLEHLLEGRWPVPR